jgi:hypothetical protein
MRPHAWPHGDPQWWGSGELPGPQRTVSYAATHRGLGAVQGFRGAGKAAEPGDRDEGLDLVDGHAITIAEDPHQIYALDGYPPPEARSPRRRPRHGY